MRGNVAPGAVFEHIALTRLHCGNGIIASAAVFVRRDGLCRFHRNATVDNVAGGYRPLAHDHRKRTARFGLDRLGQVGSVVAGIRCVDFQRGGQTPARRIGRIRQVGVHVNADNRASQDRPCPNTGDHLVFRRCNTFAPLNSSWSRSASSEACRPSYW